MCETLENRRLFSTLILSPTSITVAPVITTDAIYINGLPFSPNKGLTSAQVHSGGVSVWQPG